MIRHRLMGPVTFERIGGMDTREVLLPRMVGQAGYVRGIYGKWDVGTLRRYLPSARGFDDFCGFVNTGIDYLSHERYTGTQVTVGGNDEQNRRDVVVVGRRPGIQRERAAAPQCDPDHYRRPGVR